MHQKCIMAWFFKDCTEKPCFFGPHGLSSHGKNTSLDRIYWVNFGNISADLMYYVKSVFNLYSAVMWLQKVTGNNLQTQCILRASKICIKKFIGNQSQTGFKAGPSGLKSQNLVKKIKEKLAKQQELLTSIDSLMLIRHIDVLILKLR